jgi:N-methylhydantoinase A/oxoprolinase/acetone carboxylase beta subunit
MAVIGLGLNTGGTYTDAVVIDMVSGEVLGESKCLTTHEDLSKGIDGAISALDADVMKDVRMVALSSTLATNYVVEGKGRRVALIAVGSKFDGSIHVDRYLCVKGGHDIHGKESERLDENSIVQFLNEIKGTVEAVAVTSFLSVYNPEHEDRVKRLAKDILDVPVICGHELSSDLGFSERAVTAVLNANLLPAIRELVDSVKKVFAAHGITAPLMIVKGDGSLMNETTALERPVETIISGPAASLTGARALSGENDALVIDMGGTTTDIGVLKGGEPVISQDGASIAGKNTKVLAARIYTVGLGGDSRMSIVNGVFYLREQRVVPLCIAASLHPDLTERLRNVSETKRRYFEMPNADDSIQDIEFFMKLRDLNDCDVTGRSADFYRLIEQRGPLSLSEGAELLKTHPMALDTHELEEKGYLIRTGLTPTDLLHYEGLYTKYDVKASEYGVRYMADRMRVTPDEFDRFAKGRVIDKICVTVVKKVVSDEIGKFEADDVGREFIKRAITGVPAEGYSCEIKMTRPIVAVGAPAWAFMPQVAEKLHARLIMPKYSDVGNAVGAITGNIVQTVLLTARPARGMTTYPDPKSSIQSVYGTWEFGHLSEAVKFAEDRAREISKDLAHQAGAITVKTFVESKEESYVTRDGYGREIVKVEIRATSIGRAAAAEQARR